MLSCLVAYIENLYFYTNLLFSNYEWNLKSSLDVRHTLPFSHLSQLTFSVSSSAHEVYHSTNLKKEDDFNQ
jgi:hypothetical protein